MNLCFFCLEKIGWFFILVFLVLETKTQGNSTLAPTNPPIESCISASSCNECLNLPLNCSWCSSTTISGCINTTNEFQSTCENILSGDWNNCGVEGTDCYTNRDCNSCQTENGCTWCQVSNEGYCLGDTSLSPLVCSTGLFGNILNDGCDTNTNETVSSETTCESFQGTSQCLPFVFYDVYVKANDSQTRMSNDANEVLAFSNLPGIPPKCREIGYPFVCGVAFQKCDVIPGTNQVIPIPICRSLCEEFIQECGNIMRDVGIEPPNCNEIDIETQKPVYPDGTISHQVNGNVYEFQCNNMISDDPGFYSERVENGDFEEVNGTVALFWKSGDNGYEVVNDTVVSALSRVLTFSNNGSFYMHFTEQEIQLNQVNPLAIRLRAMSKAENLTLSSMSENYAIHATVSFEDNSMDTIYCVFDPNSDMYEIQEVLYEPPQPIKNVLIELVLQNASGRVFFDNISLKERIPESSGVVCVDPLVENIGAGPDDDLCVVGCPAPVWSDLDYSSIIVAREVISWISFFCCTWLIITWKLRNMKRISANMDDSFLYISICTLGISFAGGPYSTFGNQLAMLCTNEHDINDDSMNENLACFFQGVIYNFFSIALMFWWVCMAIKLYLAIHYPQTYGKSFLRKGRYNFDWNEKGTMILYSFHIVSWGIPTIMTIAAIGAQSIGAGWGAVVCWVRTDAWQWSTIYGPICVGMAIVTPPIIRIIYTIYKITKGTRKPQNWAVHLRFLAFLLFFFVNFAVFVSFKVYIEIGREEWYNDAERVVICRATKPADECPELVRPSVIPFYLLNFLIASEGILIFFIFGVQKENFRVWRRLLKGTISNFSKTQSDKATSGGNSVDLMDLQLSNTESNSQKNE